MSKNRVLPDWIDFYHSIPRPKNVISPAEMDLGLFDWLLDKPDVRALVKDLGLVPGFPDLWFCVACRTPKFCDVVKAFKARQAAEHAQLCRQLYLRNKPRSRYVHRTYHD